MNHSARIKAAVKAGDIDAMRNEYQDWLTEEMDKREATKRERDEAIRQRDELRAVLTRLVAWAQRCFRVSDDVHAEGAALWKDIDRLLGRDRAPAEPEAR